MPPGISPTQSKCVRNMKPIAIVPRPGHEIGLELNDSITCLRKAGIESRSAVIGRAFALLWVDGEPVPVPRGRGGDPLCENVATWLDDRFVYAQVGGLWDHPLSDPAAMDPLGKILGVLIWDAIQHVPELVLPQAVEEWTNPIIGLRGNSLRIYADQQAATQDRADRELPVRSP